MRALPHRSVTAAWDPTAGGGGTARPPHLLCRSTGAPASPRHPPPLVINFHQWPSGARGGRGTRRFPLIAKINTLKFLQEAEECGTAGKNCFIICNNTKAGGGAGGSHERRGKAEAKGWPRQGGLRCGGGGDGPGSAPPPGPRPRRMWPAGLLAEEEGAGLVLGLGRGRSAPALRAALSSSVPQFPLGFLRGWGTKRSPRHTQVPLGGLQRSTHPLGPALTSKLGALQPPPSPPAPRGAASLVRGGGDVTRRVAVRQAHLLPGRGPPPCSPLGAEIKGIFLPLGNQIKASHLPRAPFAAQTEAAGRSGRGDNRHFQHAGG